MAGNSNGALTPVQRFFRLLALDRKDITYIYIYAIFAGLITLILPLGVQAIIGLIAGGAISASLLALIGVVTLATALSGVLKVMQMSVTETIQQRIFVRSAFDFSYRLPRLRLDTLVGYYPPELVNRFFDTLTMQKGPSQNPDRFFHCYPSNRFWSAAHFVLPSVLCVF
jgi:ABC-type bacteriocin/lantibiotic exporter with double-glycine peptidase domain